MRRQLIRALVCPKCHGALKWKTSRGTVAQIREGTASCRSCDAEYPVHDGIAAFLTSRQQPEDIWEEADAGIAAFLQSEPKRAARLMEGPLRTLNPTDQLVRGLVLESRKEFKQAKMALDRAAEGMYTPEARTATKSQMSFVKNQLADREGTVVDLASGMASLLAFLLPSTTQQFVGTDISTRVLVRDQHIFRGLGLAPRLSFLAFDARHTPFADGSVSTLVTNVGLANIENPADLLKELRRIVSGVFLAIMVFYPDEKGPNTAMIRRLKLDPLLHRRSALRLFEEAGFGVRVHNSQWVTALPTPPGKIMSEVQPDRLPVAPAEVESCTLVAT